MDKPPLNTVAIEQFINAVKGAEASRAKELKLDLQTAKNLAFTLGIVMSRLNGNLEELIQKQNSNADEVIEVKMDGGNSW
jgi:hypothetical protein|tara:strand:- start:15628 stop:15867 length:240 start_codon:yes stop_codon:yes gene_type:complete